MSYPIRRGRPLREKMDFVIRELTRAVGALPPENRFSRMRNVFYDEKGKPRELRLGDPDFAVAIEAIRDMFILEAILDDLPAGTDVQRRRKIKQMIKDSVLPEDDPRRSVGRDAQAELLVAAIANCGGMNPVLLEEPDVSCQLGAIRVSVAVKRIKSKHNIETNIRKAANQVKASGRIGFIVVDVSRAMNPKNRSFALWERERFDQLHKQAIQQFVNGIQANIPKWVGGKGVRGIIIMDHKLRDDPQDKWGLSSMSIAVSTVSRPGVVPRVPTVKDNQYKEFCDRLSAGLRGR